MNSAEMHKDKVDRFERFIDRYCPSIYSAIARLTGSSDKEELETLSVNVLIALWDNSEDLFKEERPKAFIYKLLLQHVVTWLKQQGKEDQIRSLQNTVLIDPSHYAHLLEPEKKTLPITHFLRKALSSIRGTHRPPE